MNNVYRSDEHGQKLSFAETPDLPAFEIHKGNNEFSVHRIDGWGDRNLMKRADGQPSVLGKDVAFWTGRTAKQGQCRVTWQGDVLYEGEPSEVRLRLTVSPGASPVTGSTRSSSPVTSTAKAGFPMG